MGLKKYIFFSIIFLAAVGGYVYSFNGDSYTLTFFGVPVTLYVAIWIVLPVAVIVIASILHMMYYGFKGFLSSRNIQKDYKNYINAAKARLLLVDESPALKTSWFKLPSKLLKHFKFDATKDPMEIDDEDIKETILDLKKVESGEVVDLKKYKLPKDNPFMRKNLYNELAKDKKYAEEILRTCEDKEDDLCKKAFEALCGYASFDKIKSQEFKVDREIFEKLIDRVVNKDDLFKMEIDDILEYFKKFNYDKKDYLRFAKKLKSSLSPEALISLFEKISQEKESAMEAYLYILFEYQMIDKVREALENSSKQEYEKFKYLLFLRDSGKNFDIDLFFDI